MVQFFLFFSHFMTKMSPKSNNLVKVVEGIAGEVTFPRMVLLMGLIISGAWVNNQLYTLREELCSLRMQLQHVQHQPQQGLNTTLDSCIDRLSN